MRRIACVLLISSLAAAAAGCSISTSVSSPFEWSSASFGSSSGSSSRDRAEEYRNDVAEYTQAYVQSGGSFEQFTRKLNDIASQHGISNWESSDDTYIGIGRGLRRANVSEVQLHVWQDNLSHGDARKAAAIEKGYNTAPKPE
jgi:hypothetical protein